MLPADRPDPHAQPPARRGGHPRRPDDPSPGASPCWSLVVVLVGVPAGRAPADGEPRHTGADATRVEPDERAVRRPLHPDASASLPPATRVLTVSVDGFPEFARATAAPVRAGGERHLRQRRRGAVRRGRHRVVPVPRRTAASPEGPAGPGDAVLGGRAGPSTASTTAEIGTVFAAATQPPRPPDRLALDRPARRRDRHGDRVGPARRRGGAVRRVRGAGDLHGIGRCGAPGPAVTTVADEEGVAQGHPARSARDRSAPIGSPAGASSGAGWWCGRPPAVVRTPPVELAFAEPPGAVLRRWSPGHRPRRCAAPPARGAAWLLRSTDWAPVGEAAAPEIDDAEYADLDAIIAALPPEELEDASSR